MTRVRLRSWPLHVLLAAVAALAVCAAPDGSFARLEQAGSATPAVKVEARPGDTLSSIALKYYGFAEQPAMLWPLIYDANRAVLKLGPTRVTRGQELQIPTVPVDAAARSQLVEESFASIWKRYCANLETGDFQS